MAERRMFAKTIIDSDAFLDMPMSARLLYYDLAMRADDDGFINSPKKIMKFIGATNDDINILIMRKFIIPFDNGVVVIKHWRIHNYIRKDTYNETAYKEEKAMLELDENKAYRISSQLSVDGSLTQVSIGKDSIGKDSIGNNMGRFTPPDVVEVQAYCYERCNNVDAQAFVDFYSSKGWMVGKNKMKDWKAAVRTWERNRSQNGSQQKTGAIDWDNV